MFHVSDEADLLAWQSAMICADDTPMASLHAGNDAAMAAPWRRATSPSAAADHTALTAPGTACSPCQAL